MGSSALQSYWRSSRAPRYSFSFALPLLALYELLAAILPVAETHGVRNGADVILKSVFYAALGRWGPLAFGALLVGIFLWGAWKDARANGEPLRASYFVWMLGESIVLALAFGVIVGLATARLLGTLHMLALAPMQRLDTPTRLMVSLGAGLYEELLFRVILVSGLATFGRVVCRMTPRVAGAFAVVLGAVIFSAFHYVGAYGDVFTVQSFTFRLIAGLFFSALYLLRGFGIVAWTHALYDVFLLFA
ncbi:MAG: CPBP family intramembrane metalloprotease [Gemmatimonadaceae bacterium]|nr:CPBP family intramembrane metalloprotease [Gemmatimonadaceae bacterium]